MTKQYFRSILFLLFISIFSNVLGADSDSITQLSIKRKYKHNYPIEERLRSIEILEGSFHINQNLESDLSFSHGFNLWRTNLLIPSFYYAINNRINIGLAKLPHIKFILVGTPNNIENKPFQLSIGAGLFWIYSDKSSEYFWERGIIFEHAYNLDMKCIFSDKRWFTLKTLFNMYNNEIADIMVTPLIHHQMNKSISTFYGMSWQQAHYFGIGKYNEFFADVFRIHFGGKFNIGRVFSFDVKLAPGYEADRGYFFVSAGLNINCIW